MLVVKVEIHPFANSNIKELLEEIKIINNGTGNINFGNYDVIYNNERYYNIVLDYPRGLGSLSLVNQIITALQIIIKLGK